ncbi:hypothetical protein MF406_16420 [Georgenia sp. TF02-10]|uniref:hypothetical protein n=1 Tax=Georgenia sp. TF02-10 TaxID=2917725 RepID=UPI001FA73DB5|nr:hypothetical protein [Georgenia sp. TF02-10]UNX54459.1 hypothetical protein MF406_16420 [Georgenia sp. TF02-10]
MTVVAGEDLTDPTDPPTDPSEPTDPTDLTDPPTDPTDPTTEPESGSDEDAAVVDPEVVDESAPGAEGDLAGTGASTAPLLVALVLGVAGVMLVLLARCRQHQA